MEWVTLNNLCLGNQLSANFAAEWSKDGRICILSDNCVYVLKLTPKMTNIDNVLSFTRSDIKLSTYFAAENTGITTDNIILKLSQQNLYHFVLNINLTPISEYSNPPSIIPVAAAWSSTLVDEIYRSQAVLAVLSNTGNLELFVQNMCKWTVVANITELWVQNLSEEWKGKRLPSSDDKLADIHSSRVNSSLITCFAWSNIYKEKGQYFMYILAGHLNGHISWWKLNHFNACNEISEIKLVHSFQSGVNNLTSIEIYSIDVRTAWVFVGNLDGVVQSKIINFDTINEIQNINIWDHKDVRVSKILSLGFDNNIGLMALKGSYVIFSVLNKNGTLISTNHFDVGNLYITGIQLVSPGNYVITTTTGVLKSLKINKTPKGYGIKINPIVTDLKWDYHACHGIVLSPNKIIWGILIHPCKVTDHLTLRNPIQLVFCTDKGFAPEVYLKDNPSKQLINAWESLEILRCQSAKNSTLPCSWLQKIEKFDDLSLYEIRLLYWISLCSETFIQKRSKFKKFRTVLPCSIDLKGILYFKFRIERINLIFEKFDKDRELKIFDYESLYLLFDGIKSYQNYEMYPSYFGSETDDVINQIQEKYENIPMKNIPKCIWCEENLTSKPCKEKHPDQRCSISSVQISGIAKWECGKCGLPAHELNEDTGILCPLCDIPMIRMTQ